MKGKSRVVKMNHGGERNYDKIRRHEERSMQKENRHFMKVSSGFSIMGLFLMMGRFMSNFFSGMFGRGGGYGTNTTKGTSAADSRRGGIVRNRIDNRRKDSKYYKMRVPKSVRAGLSFEELQLVKKALYPKFGKEGVQMVAKTISLEEMIAIRTKVVGF